ncbi:hypothetical protein RhiirA4_463726 [Rhizophagus irregularis]|uniref:Uncharacterized protein n=1 Tax=Rhizophagus irregularis TaxID=588596 RepID=A0A2I1GNI7_9GLOM|nr:hypothetical protein RhiirA4_463726 [Rhizophagus irregularis]
MQSKMVECPEEYKECDKNIKDFDKNENEDEVENVINTGDFVLSQNSDLNSSLNFKNFDNKSKLFEYNLQELF